MKRSLQTNFLSNLKKWLITISWKYSYLRYLGNNKMRMITTISITAGIHSRRNVPATGPIFTVIE